MTTVSAEQVKAKLEAALNTAAGGSVEVEDVSGGCGSAFDVRVISSLFEGKALLARHRMVNDALKEEMASIHALSIKQAQTPQQAAATAQ